MGVGRAAEKGIVFREAAALEAIAGVDTVAFDKTGTITNGTPEVSDVVPAGTRDKGHGAGAMGQGAGDGRERPGQERPGKNPQVSALDPMEVEASASTHSS